jgi:hypothetical protein
MVPPAAAAAARRFTRWAEMGCWPAKLAAPLVTVRFSGRVGSPDCREPSRSLMVEDLVPQIGSKKKVA